MTDQWNDETERLIVELWDKHYSGLQIAKALKTTRSAILGKIARMRRKGVTFQRQYDPNKSKMVTKVPRPNAPIKVPKQLEFTPVKKPEPPPKPIVVIEEVKPYDGKPITVMQLTEQTCKFPVSGTRAPDYRFCGGPTYKRSYCKYHFGIAYTPSAAKQKPQNRVIPEMAMTKWR